MIKINMGGLRLTMVQVLKDKKCNDPLSVTSLSLPHKALSDVSCLSHCAHLERLDLAFNSLTSLEGLRSCVNLKWLSVVQNKLQSLKGIESLSELTVLNAGKNKLKSMDEVRSLVTLRALILNDNEIVSVCKLDRLKELNTLVLSRNPIREIGESLVKVKCLTKLSLSNCQLQTFGSSLISCIELKELRLAHNDIKTLPADLAYNKKLQNLDLGNNVITGWSDVKVLRSIVDLKNLNLQGNPIPKMDKVSKKVSKLLPNLHIFNARPLDNGAKKGGSGRVDDFSLITANELAVSEEEQKDSVRENGKKPKRKKLQQQLDSNNLDTEKDKHKRKKTNENFPMKDLPVHEDGYNAAEKKSKIEKSRMEQGELDVIDDGNASFADLFAVNAAESSKFLGEKNTVDKAGKEKNLMGGVITVSSKKKKTKRHGVVSTVQLPAAVEVGMGGASTWDDE